MKRSTRPVATTATRPNRILILLAAVWMVAAIAIGGLFAAQPASDTSATGTTSSVIGATRT
jgi:hypothetical protein